MPAHDVHIPALAFLVLALVCVLLLCRALARRSRRPVAIWGAGGYLALLHLIGIFGIATSTRFETGLAQLTLFTFPFSMSLFDTTHMHGFGTLHALAANYVRYILYFGGLNAMLLAAFLVLALPPSRRWTRHSRR